MDGLVVSFLYYLLGNSLQDQWDLDTDRLRPDPFCGMN